MRKEKEMRNKTKKNSFDIINIYISYLINIEIRIISTLKSKYNKLIMCGLIFKIRDEQMNQSYVRSIYINLISFVQYTHTLNKKKKKR